MRVFQWILSTVSTSFVAISAILIAFGWREIRRKNLEIHRRLMVSASVMALAFFVLYMFRTIFVGNYVFGGPEAVRPFYVIFLLCHIVLAMAGGLLGGIALYLGLRQKFVTHKKLGPWASVIWFFTAITGVVTYLLLHVFYPSGETTGLIESILGK